MHCQNCDRKRAKRYKLFNRILCRPCYHKCFNVYQRLQMKPAPVRPSTSQIAAEAWVAMAEQLRQKMQAEMMADSAFYRQLIKDDQQ